MSCLADCLHILCVRLYGTNALLTWYFNIIFNCITGIFLFREFRLFTGPQLVRVEKDWDRPALDLYSSRHACHIRSAARRRIPPFPKTCVGAFLLYKREANLLENTLRQMLTKYFLYFLNYYTRRLINILEIYGIGVAPGLYAWST
jgi:hypothetical protein